jgi:hypothetical protein
MRREGHGRIDGYHEKCSSACPLHRHFHRQDQRRNGYESTAHSEKASDEANY